MPSDPPGKRRLPGGDVASDDETVAIRRFRRSPGDLADANDVFPDRQLAALAARQRGVATRRQLLGLGLSHETIERRLRAGRLHRVFRGVYAVGHAALPPLGLETAALLAVGEGAALSHQSAAYVDGLLQREPGPVHVTVRGRQPRSQPGLVVHTSGTLTRRDLRTRQGLLVTAPERTLLDLAATEPGHTVLEAVDRAEHLRRTSRPNLESFIGANPRHRGAPKLTRLLTQPFKTRSHAERELIGLVTRAGLPPDATNVKIAGYEADLLYREPRLIVEMDSWAHHGSREAFERDRVRDAAHVAVGYRVLRSSWHQLADGPEALLARIVRAYCAN